MWNPFRSRLEARIAELERSTADRFAMLMASNAKLHSKATQLQNTNQRLAARVNALESKGNP
jgi:uncharacterized coiled-coil protein SlyX